MFGVNFSEAKQKFTPIRGVPISVAAAPLVTSWGPLGKKRAFSFAEWEKIYGGPTLSGFGWFEAKAYWDMAGDGAELWTSRVQHYSSISNPASFVGTQAEVTIPTDNNAASSGASLASIAGAYNLEPGDTLVVAIDALADVTATFLATAAALENTPAEPYVLANGQTLLVKIDGVAQAPIVFSTAEFVAIAAATAEEVAAVINAQLSGGKATVTSGGTKVTLASDKRGTGSSVEVTGGTAAAALAFPGGVVTGTGNVANIDSVTATEIKTRLDAVLGGTATVTLPGGAVLITSVITGILSKVQVKAASTADDELGFDNAIHTGLAAGAFNRIKGKAKYVGARGNNLKLRTAAASNGDATKFDLTVLEGGIPAEPAWRNLSLVAAEARYFLTVVNDTVRGSALVTLEDLVVGSAFLPEFDTTDAMTGGDDGLTGLADTDFSGSAVGGTGLRAFDQVATVTILFCPDRITPAVQNAAATYVDVTRNGDMQFISDFQTGKSVEETVAYWRNTAALLELSENLYAAYPPVKVANPDENLFGASETMVTIPLSGYVAGAWVRTDQSAPGGIYLPPAGEERGALRNVLALENEEVLDDAKFSLLYKENRICVVLKLDDSPFFIRGTKVSKSTGQFPSIAERRGATYIRKSLERAAIRDLDTNIDDRFLKQLESQTFTFLEAQLKVGAFRSRKPTGAFEIDYGPGINTAVDKFANRVNGRINIATQKPADEINVVLGQDFRDIEAELAALQAAA